MTGPPSVYSSMVSMRSRRLRTLGIALLVVLFVMSIYGFVVLMPGLHHVSSITPPLPPDAAALQHARKVLLVKVYFAYAYWGVCALLALALFFVAWLDMREVSQTYLNARRALWSATGERKGDERDPGSGVGGN